MFHIYIFFIYYCKFTFHFPENANDEQTGCSHCKFFNLQKGGWACYAQLADDMGCANHPGAIQVICMLHPAAFNGLLENLVRMKLSFTD